MSDSREQAKKGWRAIAGGRDFNDARSRAPIWRHVVKGSAASVAHGL